MEKNTQAFIKWVENHMEVQDIPADEQELNEDIQNAKRYTPRLYNLLMALCGHEDRTDILHTICVNVSEAQYKKALRALKNCGINIKERDYSLKCRHETYSLSVVMSDDEYKSVVNEFYK